MRMKDITGQRFGRLVAIEPTKRRSSGGSPYWLCECDCGNETIVVSYRLQSGVTKSCGCLRAEVAREKMRKIHAENRKHFNCIYCGSDKHYAKGLCRNCYIKKKKRNF